MLKYIAASVNFGIRAIFGDRKSRPAHLPLPKQRCAKVERFESRLFLSTSVPGQTINTPTEWTLAGSPYNLAGGVTIAAGGSLQIDSGVTVTYSVYQGSLTVASGGSLTATGEALDFPFTAQGGSRGSITGSTIGIADEFDATSLALSTDQFSADPSVVPTYVATLASNGNTFASGTVINLIAQSIVVPVTLPAITNVSSFNLSGNVTIASGGSLAISSGVNVTYTIYQSSLTVASGGSLTATSAALDFPFTAQGGSLGSITGSTFGIADEFDATSLALSSDQFARANPLVVPTYVATLASNGNTFVAGTVINLLAQSINAPVTLPAITNVSSYNLSGNVTIASAGSLAISSGVTVTYTIYQSGLTVASGGSLTATSAALDFPFTAQGGSLGSITGSTFGVADEFDATSLALSSDQFSANPSVVPTYVATLASNGNTFVAGTIINLLGQSIVVPVTLPAITNVSSFNLSGNVAIASGGSLAISSGVTVNYTIYQSSLTVDSGGSLSAIGATFDCPVGLSGGSEGTLEYDKFVVANSLTVAGTSGIAIHDDDFSNATATVASQGSGGPINMQNNWWGSTTPSVIATKITDFANNTSLPVIDYSSPLSAAPVLPAIFATVSAPAVTSSVSSSEPITVIYTDTAGGTINAGSIATGNLTVKSATGQSLTVGVTSKSASGNQETVVYSAAAPNGTWQISDNGTGTIAVNAGTVTDSMSNGVASESATFSIAVVAQVDPTVAITPPSTITTAGGGSELVTVAYTGESAPINASTLAGSNLTVTGPTGNALVVSVAGTNISGNVATVMYSIAAPGGSWQIAEDGTYSIVINSGVVRDQNGNGNAVASTTFSVAIPGTVAPVIVLQPGATTVSAGQIASFSAGASGAPAPTVQWQLSTNGTTYANIGGATAATYTFTASAGETGYYYRAIFSNSQGTATTNAAQLTVTPGISAPSVTLSPVAQTSFAGQSVTFTAAAIGNPAPTVQWESSTDNVTYNSIAGATSTTYTVTAPANSTWYRAVFTNSQGSAATTSAKLTIATAPFAPIITGQPAAQVALAGATVNFVVTFNGYPAPTVQWRVSTDGVNFSNVAGATSAVYSFAASLGQSGSVYDAVVSNSQGSVTTSSVMLTVQSTPAVTTQPTNQTVLIGSSVTYTAVATGSPAPTVQWQYSGDGGATYTLVAGATSTTYTFVPTAIETGYLYQAVFTSAAGTTASNPVTLTINIPPAVTITAPNVNAGGGSGQVVTIVYASTSAAINLSTILASNLTVTGSAGGPLNVSVFNISGSGDSVAVTYLVGATGGTWVAADNGTYTVNVNANSVTDVNGIGVFAASTSFTVDATTNLVVNVSSSSSSASVSQSVTLTASVVASAGGALTGDVTFYADGVVIGSPVAVDSSGNATISVNSLALGNYAISAVYSGDANHPLVTSGSPILQSIVIPLAVAPILTGVPTQIVIAGQTTRISQTIIIENTSGATFTEVTTVTLFLSTSITVDSSAISLSGFSLVEKINLKNTHRTSFRIKLAGVPITVPAGTYHLVAMLAGTDGKTSFGASAGTITVQTPREDLSAMLVGVPANEKTGRTISATLIVTNNGNIPAVGPLTIDLYSSTVNTLDQTAVALPSLAKHINIKPGRSTKIRVSRIVLSSIAGSYYLIARIDPNVFNDADLGNNIAVSNQVAVS